jgi:transposase-like protein
MTDRHLICVLYADQVPWHDADLEAYIERVVTYAEPTHCPSCGSLAITRETTGWWCPRCHRQFSESE